MRRRSEYYFQNSVNSASESEGIISVVGQNDFPQFQKIRRTNLKKLKEKADKAAQELSTAKAMKKKAEEEMHLAFILFVDAWEKTQLPWCAISLMRAVRRNPPKVVKLCMEAICILKGIPPELKLERKSAGKNVYMEDYWPAAQRLLSGNLPEELDNLRQPGGLSWVNISQFQKHFQGHPDFDRAKIMHAFPPCAILYDWICAVEYYGGVLAAVEEKEEALYLADQLYKDKKVNLKFYLNHISEVKRAIRKAEEE